MTERRGKVSVHPDGRIPADGSMVDPETAWFFAVWRDETERWIEEAHFKGAEAALEWGRERADVVWISLGSDIEAWFSAGRTHSERVRRWPPPAPPPSGWWPQPDLPTLEEIAAVAADARAGAVEQAGAWASQRIAEAGLRNIDDPRFLALVELEDDTRRELEARGGAASAEEPPPPILVAAQHRLTEMLTAAGLELAALDPERTWRIFKAFAAEAVEGTGEDPDDDMLLFEYGVYDWYDGRGLRFNWSLCRQFTVYVNGEYDHMEQLRCDLFFEPTRELDLDGSTPMLPSTMVDEWATAVEQLDGFRAVLGLTPVESRVEQQQV